MATTSATTPADAALKRGFLLGCVAVAALLIFFGALIKLADQGTHRAEGTAEQWLAAVGDSARKGVAEDSRKRADELGGFAIGQVLLPPPSATDGKVAFPDLEVGKASVVAGVTRVPYQLHQRAKTGANPLKKGVVTLAKQADGTWDVTGLTDATAGERVPSDGGDPPSSAPVVLYGIGILVGIGVTVACSTLVVWAGRGSAAAA